MRYIGGTPKVQKLLLGLSNHLVCVKENCTFNGLVPVMGLSAKWHIGRGVSVFNEFTIGALYGKFQIKHSERYSANDLSKISLKK